MDNIYVHRFFIESESLKTQVLIGYWFTENYHVYEYNSASGHIEGRYISSRPFVPLTFLRLTDAYRSDRSLHLRITSSALDTPYVESNIYRWGRWHHIRL